MDNRLQTDSPFAPPRKVRLSFGTLMLMLLTVVGAGVGMLIYYALRVPAITTELYAWLGRPVVSVDSAQARQAQVVFALFVYTAPMALGILVYGLHHLLNWLDRAMRDRQPATEDEFRMD